MTEGLLPKLISIAVALCFLPFFSEVTGLGKIAVRALPIFLAPFALIWFPETTAQFFSSHANERDIRRWGLIGLLLLAIPAGIALAALRGMN